MNLALHPLKVQEQEILQFPPVESTVVESGDFEREIDDLRRDIRELQEIINESKEQTELENTYDGIMIMIAIGLSIVGIGLGAASLAKKK